jgi:hypothetical protein
MKSPRVDLTGKKFTRLTVIKLSHRNKRGENFWHCKCDCGVETIKQGYLLVTGGTKSCGCLHREIIVKHGLTYVNSGCGMIRRLYSIWVNMRSRCSNPKIKSFPNYGGRGIKVCSEWNEYMTFHNWAMSHGYNDSLTIDRINPYSNYEPGNCQWITRSENARKIKQDELKYGGRVIV